MQPPGRNTSADDLSFPLAFISLCRVSTCISFVLPTLSWRIIVNSPIPIKMLSHRLVLISAAILLHANSVFAAEFVGDAQMQARDLLSGTVGGRANTINASPAIPVDGHQTSILDPQEQARQLILGKPSFGRVAGSSVSLDSKRQVTPAVSAQGSGRVYSDAQESARRMILGMGA
jgi:hypothetical protein